LGFTISKVIQRMHWRF